MTGLSSSLPEPFARTPAQQGFTLVELAIALFVIGLLLAGALIPLSTQMEVRSVAETQRTIEQIKEAIIGFAQVNGRLPCPALGNIAIGAANAGTEDRELVAGTGTPVPIGKQVWSCSPSNAVGKGVVPWTTLGVPETDAWGNRFSYWVVPAFADEILVSDGSGGPAKTTYGPTQAGTSAATCGYDFLTPAPANSSFALCSLGNLTVNTRSDTHTTSAIAQNLPLVIVSHGKNGYGAWKPIGSKGAASDDAGGDGVPDQNVDETANATAGNTTFIYRNRSGSSTGCSDTVNGSQFCEFDDIVVWISTNLLVSRMVSAGKLP